MDPSNRTGKNDELGKGPRQTRRDRAILALLQHVTVEKAAAAVNLHPSTLYRWLKEPDFRDQFLEARSRAFAQSLARLQQAAPVAASRLLQVMAHPGHAARQRDPGLRFHLESRRAGLSIGRARGAPLQTGAKLLGGAR